jgi:hypothetical protein
MTTQKRILKISINGNRFSGTFVIIAYSKYGKHAKEYTKKYVYSGRKRGR